jgi:hypothetical protein
MVFIILMVLFHPFRETFQQDTDEGINLIKAVLVMEGHQITGDIASDQPPLLSNLLAMVFERTGVSVNIGRFVILLFSALLLGAAGMAAEIAWGRTTSIFVYVMMILLPNYLLASVSVMIGQPSIALAMVAMLCVFLWHRDRNWPWLLLAGLFMSLSLFMKIFTAILIPILGIGLLVGQWMHLRGTAKGISYWVQLMKPAFIFSLSLVVISAALALVFVDLENGMDLILPHLEYRQLTSVTGSITADLKPALFPILLAAIGLGSTIAKQKWLGLYPAAWAILAYLSLLNHNPVWWHHQLLITVPAAMLAAYGVTSILKWFKGLNQDQSWKWKVLVFCGILIIGAFLNQQLRVVGVELENRAPSFRSYGLDPESGDMRILSEMNSLAQEGTLIVTDMPIFAVRAKMLIPVELAWVSDKRFRTGFLSEQDFIDVIERDKPTLVLIARYPLSEVRAYLDSNPNYEEVLSTKIHTDRKATLYHRIEP